MKIGIITVQDSNNFGSFLQAYALQDVLEKMGHDVYFIRTRSKEYIKKLFYHNIPNKHELKYFFSFIKNNYGGRKKYKRFKEEQKCFKVLDNYEEFLDVVILGSDEIWNVTTPVFRNDIFYGRDMKSVMTYGVSIGNATLKDMHCIDVNNFKNIRPILVRDNHTSDYLESVGINSSVVCDPTFLVDPQIFKRNYSDSLLDGAPYMLIYSYGLDEDIVKALKEFAKKRGLRILSVCFEFDWCDGMIDCAALDFSTVMEKAEYVFTSTFHGTIFSILNHKKFISLPCSRKTSDLLAQMQLTCRLVNIEECSSEIIEYKMVDEIDYDKIDGIISYMRETSIEKLKDGISLYD